MSKDAIHGLKPQALWQRFYELTQVPRPSKKEEKIQAHLMNFASENKIDAAKDKAGNVLLKFPASKGFEKSQTVILQGHVDMVCEKNKDKVHDFENDPIELLREGDWITANGTTLGADNGVGVAAAIAVAMDKSAKHGPLEVLCTSDEETGMTGVNNLQKGFIKGKILLNLDSEEDGAFYVGCSGGQDTVGTFNIEYSNARRGYKPFEIMVTGLRGGHSGLDITNGRANAIKLLAQFLYKLQVPYQVASISGGSLRNAIPREAEAILLLKDGDDRKVRSAANKFVKNALLEYKTNDSGIIVKVKKLNDKVSKAYKTELTDTLIKTLVAMPHGIMAMSSDMPGLVETSTNLATLKVDKNIIVIGTSQRSSIESAKENITERVVSVFELAGAKAVIGESYPGWQPNMESDLLATSKKVYKRLFKSEPEIKAIHAGLETGLIGSKFPGIDMISFGPTIMGAHSPEEKVNIPDVERFYKLLKGILAELSRK